MDGLSALCGLLSPVVCIPLSFPLHLPSVILLFLPKSKRIKVKSEMQKSFISLNLKFIYTKWGKDCSVNFNFFYPSFPPQLDLLNRGRKLNVH